MENNIRVLYRFIVYNFEPGDELYLFGFSRGAFTVRSLAGFMYKVGLIEKDDDYYVPEIYGCYERNLGPGTPEWTKAFHNMKGTRPCLPIRFIGVWDTVGALGAPGLLGQIFNKDKYKYHDVGLSPAIQHACHALAIDERRKPFAPDIWQRPSGWSGQLEQAWFPGVHGNVGGGYAPDGLANEPLQWMVEKAEGLGLEFDSTYLAHFVPCFNSVLHDSMTPLYKAMGPLVRALGQHAVRPAVKIGSPPRPHFQKSYWTLKRTKRAVRISVGMRHAAKLLFSVSTGLALSALKMSTLSIVRVPLNRMSLATRTSS